MKKGYKIYDGGSKGIRDLRYYFEKAKTLPLKILVLKSTRRLYNFFATIFEGLKERIFPTKVKKNLFLRNSAFSTFEEVLEYFKKREKPYLKIPFDFDTDEFLPIAEKVLQDRFVIFGEERIFKGWHRDYFAGKKWNRNVYYRKVNYFDGDPRTVWELNRFHFLLPISIAFEKTGEEKYVEKFKELIEGWIVANRFKFGINWNCPMEVAIRASNWIVAFEVFKKSSKIDAFFIKKFVKALYLHGYFIYSNLEYQESLTSNHYLADLCGLFYIGLFFKDFSFGKEWLEFSISEFEKEIEKQVYTDGIDFESSTYYHRLATEFFFYPLFLVQKNNINFSEQYQGKVKKMFEFLFSIMEENGQLPQIGDNDSGFLHMIEKDERKVCNFLKLGLSFFGERSLERKKRFEKGGVYILGNNRDILIFSATPNGQNGNGGHTHNDKLSFQLTIGVEEFIVDPGTYIYVGNPAERNYFRSVFSHTTVLVDNKEQNDFLTLFSMKDESQAEVLEFYDTSEKSFISAQHYGYRKIKDSLIHRREILLIKKEKCWQVTDVITNEKKHLKNTHLIQWNIILHPNVKIDLGQGKVSLKRESKLVVEFEEDTPEVKVERSFYSPHYGKKVPTFKLSWQKEIERPLIFKWRIKKI